MGVFILYLSGEREVSVFFKPFFSGFIKAIENVAKEDLRLVTIMGVSHFIWVVRGRCQPSWDVNYLVS